MNQHIVNIKSALLFLGVTFFFYCLLALLISITFIVDYVSVVQCPIYLFLGLFGCVFVAFWITNDYYLSKTTK